MGIFTFKNIFSDVAISGLTESVLPPLVLNMTITGSVVILFVLLARLALKKAPKIFSYALWAVVLFRLLCPVSITTDFSLLGLFDTPAVENTQHTTAVEYIPYDVVHTPELEVQLPVPPIVNEAVNHALPQEHAALGADPLEGEFAIGSFIWLLGIGAMAVYSMVSYILLRRKLVGAVLLRDNIYLADGIDSPFVMGLFRPKIYLPSALSEQEQGYIILHEQHHIRRGDHLVKALAFIALCIHWFNPLVWVAFVLSSKDMEMSCDEAVVKKLGEGIRADYSASLLSLATGRRIIAGTPLAFGEGDTKSRIKNMLNWKKPAVWITVLATVVCIVVLAVCGTNAANRTWIHLEEKSTESGAPRYTWNLEQPIQSWAIYEDVYSDGRLISSVARISDSFVDNGGASGRNDSFFLDVMPIFAANDDGFINELKVVYSGAGTIEWTLLLPHSHYSASAGQNPLSREPFDTRNRFKLENNDEIILYSQLFSTAEDGSIYVDDLKNDAVVQYRLVTSTELATEFNRQDHALDLYELRIPILQSPELARPLVERLGVNEWGTYTLDRWSDANSSGLLIAFENAPKDEDALMRQMHPVVYLLTALIGDIDGVHYSFPRGEEQQELITVYDTHDADRYAEAIGFKNLKTVACSPVGIRMLIDYLGWTGGSAESEPTGNYGTAQDVSYYLELAVGESFRYVSVNRQFGILAEYEGLLDDYTLIVRETEDGKTAYIVGQYNGNPTESPLYGMYSIGGSVGEEEWNLLYREEDSAAVDAALTAGKIPDVGYLIDKSYIRWSSDNGLILIQPKDTEIVLDVPWSRYLHTPNGREYITDAVSRGIDVCGRTDTFLYVYLISERFGEIAERIALTEAEAQAILAEERVNITDGFGFSATLHIGDQTTYFNEREGAPQSVIDLAVEKCRYRFESPDAITGDIVEATLDMAALDTTLHAEKSDLPRLKEILTNAEFGYVGSCGYGAKLTLTFTGGEKLTVFKGTDDCDTIVFGSYGGYFLGDKENIEFWEMFGLDPDTKVRIETNPADAKDEVLRLFNEHPWRGATFHSRDYAPSNVVFGSPDTVTKIGRVFSSAQWEYVEAPESEPAWENLIAMYPFVFYDQGGLVRYGGPELGRNEPPMKEAVWYRAPGVFEAMEEATDTHFIENDDRPAEPTETDIHNALMSNYTVMHDESEATRPYRTEAHHIWDVRQDGNTANVYALVNFTTYGWDNGRQKRVAWWDGPAKLTFTWSDGWQLTDFWRWTEDEQYETAIQNRFPANVAEIALGPMDSDISASMNTRTYEAAAAYYATQSGLSVYQPFTPADEEFTGQALVASQDEMSYEERLEWIQTVTSYEQDRNYISLNQYQEGAGCIAYTGQWVGTPHMDQYTLGIRFADGTTASLPLPRNGYWGSALPDTMRFEGGKFVYEKAFPTEEVTNEGETLIHLKGTYHYEVDLAAKTVSLTVLQ